MAWEQLTGLNVQAQYGPRSTGGPVGVTTDKDAVHEMTVDITWQSLTEGYKPVFVLPRGAHFLRFLARVDEALTLTGTTPTILIGDATPLTNGMVISAAEAAAVGTKVLATTGVGTWSATSATGTTAAARVTVSLGGTTPAVTPGAGKIRVIAEYVMATRV